MTGGAIRTEAAFVHIIATMTAMAIVGRAFKRLRRVALRAGNYYM